MLMTVPLTKSCLDASEEGLSPTVAYADAEKMLVGLVQGIPAEVWFTAAVGVPGANADKLLSVEAYPVALEMLLGKFHAGPLNMEPMFGPTNNPVEEMADAVRSFTVKKGPFTTIATKCVASTDSANTSCPFNTDKLPVNPLRKNPSLGVGSGPTYVKLARPPLPKEYPVISRTVE
jgi:hypothetical protein